MGDLDRLRARLAAGPAPGPGAASGGSGGFLGKVTSTGSNLGVGKFFLATPTTVMGAEVDSAAGSLADAAGSVAVYALGPGTPATGDYLACRWVDYRWVADKPAGGGGRVDTVTVQNCFCPVPKTLRMTSADPNCNYQMFQSCTLQYGPPPAWLASLNITGPTWLSTEQFLDPIANASFYYQLFCLYNQFLLTRLYPTSPYGSPFRDGTLYNWVLGGGSCRDGVMQTNDCTDAAYTSPCWRAWFECVSAKYRQAHQGRYLSFNVSGDPTNDFGVPVDVSGADYAQCGQRPAYRYTAPGFRLHGGAPFPGSDATCSVTIDPA